MDQWRGQWALITGASAGIGKAFAEVLAGGGTNLVLTARRRERLDSLAKSLSSAHAIRAEVCSADLADPGGPEQVFAFTAERSIEISLLINNAGFGAYGEFADMALERLLQMVQVNCSAVIHLTRLFLPKMIARRKGDILIVASTAAFQAVPYISTYAATKGFDLLFAEGLAEEVREHGVRVCGLCPGSTISEFHEVAGQTRFIGRHRQESAEKVARTGLAALLAGKSCVISGTRNYLGANLQRLVPRRLVSQIAAGMFRPPKRG